MMAFARALLALIALVMALPAQAATSLAHRVTITTLSTMLADQGIGEWGYAALVDIDGHRVLFDTGAHADVVFRISTMTTPAGCWRCAER